MQEKSQLVLSNLQKNIQILDSWSRLFNAESARFKKQTLLRNKFKNKEAPLFDAHGPSTESCKLYCDLLDEQVGKEIKQHAKLLMDLKVKLNSALLKYAQEKKQQEAVLLEIQTLVEKAEFLMNSKIDLLKDNIYLSLNYKMDYFAKSLEAHTFIYQNTKFEAPQQKLTELLGVPAQALPK